MEVIALVVSLAALVVAAWGWMVARSRGPTNWARRVADVELGLADQAERHEALQRQVAKWRSRQAARERRAADDDDDDDQDRGEPDPVRNPAAWKAWYNSGGRPARRN